MLLEQYTHIDEPLDGPGLDPLLDEVAAGTNGFTVICGPATMGKSALLQKIVERATAAGTTVLGATGSPDEQDLPYAALGKLFTGLGVDTAGPARGPLRVARETHRAVADLNAAGPVLIAIDDAQYIDDESLRCLQQLAYGVQSIPFALVLTWEPQLAAPPRRILEDLIYRPRVQRIQVGPLTYRDILRMTGSRLSAAEADTLARRCLDLGGGNPLLTCALLEETLPMSREPSGVDAFRQAVLVCLHRMGPVATRVARAIAILDRAPDTGLISRLTELGTGVTAGTVQRLVEVGVLAEGGFRHPETQSAVIAEIPADEAIDLRYRAAQLLYEEGEPSRSVISQLSAAGPLPREWVLPVLCSAAQDALADGEISAAIQYLNFAVDCCPDEDRRYATKARVAALYRLVEPVSSGPRHLALKAPALAGKVGQREALKLAEGLLWHLQFDDALDVVAEVAARDDGFSLGTEWRQLRHLVAAGYPGLLTRLEALLPEAARSAATAPVIAPPSLRAVQSLSTVVTQSGGEHTVALAEQVLQDSTVAQGSLEVAATAIFSLVYADMLDTAADWCDRLQSELHGADGIAWNALFGALRALVALRRGQIDIALEQSQQALKFVPDNERSIRSALLLAMLVEGHTAAGNHEAAAECLSRPIRQQVLETRAGLHYLFARGRHHQAMDRPHAALADFMACGERMIQWNMDSPSVAPWRVGAAEVWLALGKRHHAAQLVEEQMSRLGAGLPRSRGIVLRCLAAVRDVGERPGILGDALKALQAGHDRLESARALADLSETFQSLGNKADARTVARRARRLADSCHAEGLVQVLTPYHSAGRPEKHKRPMGEGQFAALSDSERRVAMLAAAGHSNREIATKIFVTVSTVEQHLTRVYRKLNITSREQLPVEFRMEAAEIS